MRFNEKLDHLQARHPFPYNLMTGSLVGGVLLLLGFPVVIAAAYVLSWATIRALLYRDGAILRRQYEERVVRIAAEKAEKRRRW